MNGVVGMAELLCGTDLTEDQRLFAETIRSSGEALLAIINDILDWSKIEAGRMALRTAPFDLERLIHETAILLQPQARAKGIDLLVDYDMFLPTRLVGDAGRLRQVLTNLMGNAVKFTETGHVLVRVVGSVEGPGDARLHVTVEDTGIGIAPEHVEHIFGEFNQVESAEDRRYQGTGLGLAITRRLIERMEGRLWVESEPGQGSCFGFALALPVAEATAAPGLPTALHHVLLAEANPVNRAILERQLHQLGIAVRHHRPGLDTAPDASVDLFLIDADPGAEDGLALLSDLRAQGHSAPALLMAAPDAIARAEAAVEQGLAQAVLAKPVLRADLFAGLMRMTGARLPAPADTPHPAPRQQLRVLAAEDNRTNQLVLAKMLRDLDIDLRFAEDGRQAVDLWRSFHPDLIFMDISMPVMDGCAAARSIRDAEGSLAHVPIIALTAHAMEEDGDRIRASGMDHHLTKPLRRSAILDVLTRYAALPESQASAA